MSVSSVETCLRVYQAFYKVIQVYYKEKGTKTLTLRNTTRYSSSPRIEDISGTKLEVRVKFLLGFCKCTVDSDFGTGAFSLVLGLLQVCGHSHVRSHVSPGMHYFTLLH